MDRDRLWPPVRGEVVRGRKGMLELDHEGELGDEGFGSVLLLIVGGFLAASKSRDEGTLRLARRNEGTGDERNSSIRSVSGTGSMVIDYDGKRHMRSEA
jgi:hypothetical protein